MSQRAKVIEKTSMAKKDKSVSHIRKTNYSQSINSPADRILFLQRTIGNQAVQRLIRSGALQTKLRISKPDDIYEQEADRVADAVMRMPEPQKVTQHGVEPFIQSVCPGCEKEELRRQPVEEDIESQIQAIRSGGKPLPESVRAYFEPRFGYDFSQVRAHTDAQAADTARMVNAHAFTMGRDIVFGAGQYEPGTAVGRGKRLLAHELVHTIQQGAVRRVLRSTSLTDQEDNAVGELGTALSAFQKGQPFHSISKEPEHIAREEAVPEAVEGCVPRPGIPPTDCAAYLENIWWLPLAYVNNATCACITTPDSPTANCVRRFLQERLAATPAWLKVAAASQKINDNIAIPDMYARYMAFVQAFLTPRIYRDHVDAYSRCCCPSGPAPYPSWVGVTSVPIQPCELVGLSIRYFGSCHGTPGRW